MEEAYKFIRKIVLHLITSQPPNLITLNPSQPQTQMITFSIITCTYNAYDCLPRTLKSVERQSYAHIEHLIIDGKSKDDTLKLVQEYAERQQNGHEIKIQSEPDKGLYDAMNKGIRKATGDYLVFMNAGDAFASDDTLSEIVKLLESENVKNNSRYHGVGVIYGDTDIVDDNGIFIRKRDHRPPKELTWKSFKWGMLVCHQSFYVRTSIAKRVEYDLSYRLSADVDWCIKVMKECEKQSLQLFNTQLTLTSYLDGGMSVQNHRASLMERFRIMTAHYGLVSTIVQHAMFVLRAFRRKIF